LVFAEALAKGVPASACLTQDPRKALPQVTLTEAVVGGEWVPRFDLLSSAGDALHFVVEIDDEGVAHLRFGDGEAGHMPDAGTVFAATYRVGGGLAGNVGPEAISRVVLRGGLTLSGVTMSARNPLAACGGRGQEPIAEAKLFAPRAFRKELRRAITAEDYAAIVMREFRGQVQRAGAELRWTGGWYSVRVAIDPRGTLEASPALLAEIARRLRVYRRMGHDVQVVPARYVPLDVVMCVCVRPHFLRGHVEAALLDVFQSGLRSDGQLGFFHPDKLTFGDAIYLSRLVSAAQSVEGVQSVRVLRLERLFEGGNGEIERGFLPIGLLEIARLDADSNNPENGRLKLDLQGGR
jgi:predicted phage baseplate assembly protein